MTDLILLVKTGFINQWKLNELKNRHDKKKRSNTILLLVVFVFLGILIAGYSAGGAFGLMYMGMGSLIPSAAITIVSLITLFFTIIKTNGILFGYKDYDILSSLPIKTETLVASRFMQLYMVNLLVSILVMLPMGLVFGILSKEKGLFYLFWLVSTAAAPLIPTTLAAVIGVVIMSISSRMKHAKLISTLLSLLLVIAILGGTTYLSSIQNELDITKLSEVFTQMETMLWKAYPVSRLFQSAITDKSWLAFFIFVLGSYAWYRIFITLTGWKYRKIQSSLASHNTSTAKTGPLRYSPETPAKALFLKEWKRFLNSNIYLLNTGMGVVMLLLMSVAVTLIPEKTIVQYLAQGGIEIDIQRAVSIFAPFLIAGLSGMTCTTSCSLSLEGSNIEVLKTLPLPPKDIYKSKILMNLSLQLPASILASLLISLKFAQNIVDVLLIFLLPLSMDIFNSLWGMYVNIRTPNFSWDSEIVVVKQSLPTFLGIMSGFLLAIAGAVITILLPDMIQQIWIFIMAVIVSGLSLLLYKKIAITPLPEI